MERIFDKELVKNVSVKNPMSIKLPFLDYNAENEVSHKLVNLVWTNANVHDRMDVIIIEVAPKKYQDYYYNDYQECWKKLTYANDKFTPAKNWLIEGIDATCPRFFNKKTLAD